MTFISEPANSERSEPETICFSDDPFFHKKLKKRKEADSWKKGICGICPAACWVEVGFHENEIVDIKADPSHSLGMLCH